MFVKIFKVVGKLLLTVTNIFDPLWQMTWGSIWNVENWEKKPVKSITGADHLSTAWKINSYHWLRAAVKK